MKGSRRSTIGAVMAKALEVHEASRPPGFQDLETFLEEIREDNFILPPSPATKRIAAAFAAVLSGEVRPRDLDAALRLRPRRGRQAATWNDRRDDAHGRVCRFVDAELAKDTRRGALSRAIEAAATKFGIEVRTVQRALERAKQVRDIERFERGAGLSVKDLAQLERRILRLQQRIAEREKTTSK